MLKDTPIIPYIPVADIVRARKFYEEKVGLVPREEYAGGVIYECGQGSWCINNACVKGCTADSDCTSTQACQGGLCKARPAGTCSQFHWGSARAIAASDPWTARYRLGASSGSAVGRRE